MPRPTSEPPLSSRDSPILRESTTVFQNPSTPHIFTADEISEGENKINRQSSVKAIYEWPLGTTLEYPQSSQNDTDAIGHRFVIDPKNGLQDGHPKHNFQYSLGGIHGTTYGQQCRLLVDTQTRTGAVCKVTCTSCLSVKSCEFRGDHGLLCVQDSFHDAEKEVFMKTLAFYAVLQDRGCPYEFERDSSLEDPSGMSSLESSDDEDILNGIRIRDIRAPKREKTCDGKLSLHWNSAGKPFIKCEYYRLKHRQHLFIRCLDEYDIDYLAALLQQDHANIRTFEERAMHNGYGPLTACSFVSSMTEQKQLCPNFHRDINGMLRRGELIQESSCPVSFTIFEPKNLETCPQILITPETIRKLLESWLKELDWQLADMTPRRIMLNTGFMKTLRQHLKWPHAHDPPLSALHASLQNRDHVARIIMELRKVFYADGIGFEGVHALMEKQKALPLEERYVRAVETKRFTGDHEARFIICMTSAMSRLIVNARRISIEIRSKELMVGKSLRLKLGMIVNYVSADSHFFLFERTFQIAFEDTGRKVQFRHIHGTGIETVVADAHKGQGNGLGLVCVSMAKELHGNCIYHPDDLTCCLAKMSGTQHLAHCYIQCTNHFECKITNMRNQISEICRKAMFSLSSTHPLPDFEGTKELIRASNKKAADWIKDKEKGTPFMIPGLYHPKSRIPLEVWRASPHTTNGNEQAHRTVYRTGIMLSSLAAVMRGMHFDFQAMYSVNEDLVIQTRDRLSTIYNRLQTSVGRKVCVAKRKLDHIDTEMSGHYEEIDELLPLIQSLEGQLRQLPYRSENYETTARKLQEVVNQYEEHWRNAERLADQSSGSGVRERDMEIPTKKKRKPRAKKVKNNNMASEPVINVVQQHYPQSSVAPQPQPNPTLQLDRSSFIASSSSSHHMPAVQDYQSLPRFNSQFLLPPTHVEQHPSSSVFYAHQNAGYQLPPPPPPPLLHQPREAYQLAPIGNPSSPHRADRLLQPPHHGVRLPAPYHGYQLPPLLQLNHENGLPLPPPPHHGYQLPPPREYQFPQPAAPRITEQPLMRNTTQLQIMDRGESQSYHYTDSRPPARR
ncbi:hypothetical protein M422DRAFT_249509 [Sphaerobolus stellatus SS14]|uniref:Uncharacterized protein n=1 Tax=Sphaerobolus stellatus (strain SS14) TaxID=990650 RepID=A0A0C9W4Z9_SPHS4|nr:hypothetical protein M422DRAFT_249509 [Sphaerobolus stellatus SS14]